MNFFYVPIVQHSVPDSITLNVPTSKSISNRLLLLKETFNPNLKINNISEANDTCLLIDLLSEIKNYPPDKEEIKIINADNCGTAFRFLCAYLCFQKGKWLLTGNNRMKNRPIDGLVNLMRTCGATINYKENEGFPPIEIMGNTCQATIEELVINSLESSQFVSAFLLILPLLKKDMVLHFSKSISSLSYIYMTINLMQQIGIDISIQENRIYYIHKPPIRQETIINIESDWSAAAYWFVWVALQKAAKIFIKNLQKSSMQSDAVVQDIVQNFGVDVIFTGEGAWIEKTSNIKPAFFTFDCRTNLDLVPSLAVLCAGSKVSTTLNGITNLAYKESNRIESLINELSKISHIEFRNNSLEIFPIDNSEQITPHFKTYNDHRMAMSLSLLAACFPKIYIDNTDCVNKSYPGFWDNMKNLGMEITI